MAPFGEPSDRGARPTAGRRVRQSAVHLASTVRATLLRVTRRVAEAVTTPRRRKTDSVQALHDEYRAGFSMPLPHQTSAESDHHACPWCISLGRPLDADDT